MDIAVKKSSVSFQTLQTQFTNYLRDPDNHQPPEGSQPQRLAIYKELVFSNLSTTLSKAFPVMYSILDQATWHKLIRQYLIHYSARTPFFYEIAGEFLEYLFSEPSVWVQDWPFLGELAHYEYAELRLAFAQDKVFKGQSMSVDDMDLNEKPFLSPLAWVLAYRYPVHKISLDYQPKTCPDDITYLIIYRNRKHHIHFLAINAFTAKLMELCKDNQSLTAREVLVAMSEVMEADLGEEVMEQGLSVFRDFKSRDILVVV